MRGVRRPQCCWRHILPDLASGRSRDKPSPIIPPEWGKMSTKSPACRAGTAEPHKGSFKEEFNRSVKEATRKDTPQSQTLIHRCPSIWTHVPGVEASQGVPETPLATQASGHPHQALWDVTHTCRLVHCLALKPHSFPPLFRARRSRNASSYHHIPDGYYGYQKAAASLHPASPRVLTATHCPRGRPQSCLLC